MAEEYKWWIIKEYLNYVDENFVLNLADGDIYIPHPSIRIHADDERFLLVYETKFCKNFNAWVMTTDHYKYLKENTNYDYLEDHSGWLDYLTGNMWGYSDEYGCCTECNQLLRIVGNSYHWQPNYWRGDGFRICEDCVKKDKEGYIEHLVDNPNACNTILTSTELEELGFKKYNTYNYQHGWYGRVDRPVDILEKLNKENMDRVYLFHLEGNQQFCQEFSFYYRDLEWNKEVA